MVGQHVHVISVETHSTHNQLYETCLKKNITDLSENSLAIVFGAGQASVEVTGLLGGLRWVVSYNIYFKKRNSIKKMFVIFTKQLFHS